MDTTCDAMVVGGGPAGLAAALWTARYRRRVLLADNAQHRNRWTDRVHGYLGQDPVAPAELRARGRKELLAYPNADVVDVPVESVARRDGVFELTGPDLHVTARRLVLATGVRDVVPAIEGFYDHYGISAWHCPGCDGYEARDRRVVVVGWGEQVTGFACELLDWAAEVTVVTDSDSLAAAPADRSVLAAAGVETVPGDPVRFRGTPRDLEGLELADGRVVAGDMCFFTIAHEVVSPLADALGCARDEDGYIMVDHEQQTTVAGVYAAGDLTPGLQLASVAAGQGTTAGVACARSLQPPRPA